MMTCGGKREWILVVILLLAVSQSTIFHHGSFMAAAADAAENALVAALVSEDSSDEEGEDVDALGNNADMYLYNKDAGPVIEYRPKKKKDSDEKNQRPAFLYTAYEHPRVVEFYAPWCPHCRHFRDHYVEFAEKITQVAGQHGVKVKVYAVSCTVHKSVCKDFNIHGYPSIRLFAARSVNVTAEAQYWKLHAFQVLNDLNVHFDTGLSLEAPPAAAAAAARIKANNNNMAGLRKSDQYHHNNEIDANKMNLLLRRHHRSREETFRDAYLSFRFAIKNAVYMTNGPLSNSTADHFSAWLHLLQKSMPPTWMEIHYVIKAILANWHKAIQGEDQLSEILSPLEEQEPEPQQQQWSQDCQYTCGLWSLFHIMTVGVVEWNLMIGGDRIRDMSIATDEASLILRNYVANFFGCEVCRTHFTAAYDTCSLDRCHRLHKDAVTVQEWIQLPMWLFEEHNSVNVRLMKEKADSEGRPIPSHQDEINAMWPPRTDCPKCWRDDGGWDEQAVYKYMRLEYWPEDSVSTEYRRDLFDDAAAEAQAAANDEFYNSRDRDWWKVFFFFFTIVPAGSSTVSLLLPFLVVTAVPVAWHVRRIMERNRSGRHKKTDA